MQNKYPLWKNLLLIIIAVIGLIYAIPNLYTEHPVVQISAQTPIDIDQLKEKIESILKISWNIVSFLLKMKGLKWYLNLLMISY